jgi:hypothetical protein
MIVNGTKDPVLQLMLSGNGKKVNRNQPLNSKLTMNRFSQLDKTSLYGQGSAANQPTGVLNTAGCNSITTAVGPTWNDLATMRYASTNYDADLTTFGWISNQKGRKYFENDHALYECGR